MTGEHGFVLCREKLHVSAFPGRVGDCPKEMQMFTGFLFVFEGVGFSVFVVRALWEKPFKADMGGDSLLFLGGGLVNPGRFGGSEVRNFEGS